jgi:catechol 2,3-dioxygenase-like lactoylglutathione lyase family enzyme
MTARFDMVGIYVNDIQKMVNFYQNILGFVINYDGKGPYAEFEHTGIRVSMYERRLLPALLGQSPAYPAGINGTFELAIDLPYFEDVDPEYERLVNGGAGPIYAPRNEPWGMRSSMVTDPEGNLIELGSWNKGPA